MRSVNGLLFVEAGQAVWEAEIAVDGGEDALDLSHGEHAAEEGVAGVVTFVSVTQHGHAMVYTHREAWIFLFEDADEFYDVRAATEVAGFGEIAVREDMTRTEMDEMGSRSELMSHFHDFVLRSCGERTGAEGKAVMRVVDSSEEPFYVFLGCHDAREAEDRERRVVRMDTHVHAAFLAYRHDGRKEVAHVLAQLVLGYAVVERQELAEELDRVLVVFADVSADEALGLHDDVLDELVLPFRGHVCAEFIDLRKDIAVDVESRYLEGSPFLTGTFPTYYIYVEVCEIRV